MYRYQRVLQKSIGTLTLSLKKLSRCIPTNKQINLLKEKKRKKEKIGNRYQNLPRKRQLELAMKNYDYI